MSTLRPWHFWIKCCLTPCNCCMTLNQNGCCVSLSSVNIQRQQPSNQKTGWFAACCCLKDLLQVYYKAFIAEAHYNLFVLLG